MKYSLDEIDFMRWAVAVLRSANHETHSITSGTRSDFIFADQAEEKGREEHLRTLMQNGTEPSELAQRVMAARPGDQPRDAWPAQFEAFKPRPPA